MPRALPDLPPPRERGVRGLWRRAMAGRSEVSRTLRDPRRWHTLPTALARRWWAGDHALLGLLVAARGDRVRVDGCDIDLADEAVSLKVKSRFVLDRYERPERQAVRRYLDRRRPVLELGACLGVLACVTHRLLEPDVPHVVIEANPDLLPVIERQRALNGASFVVEHAVLGYDREAVFWVDRARVTASSAQRPRGAPVHVPARSLADLVEQYDLRSFTLISDIEGGELELVEREGEVLAHRVRMLILETHPDVYGEEGVVRILDALRSAGFALLHQDGAVFVFENPTCRPA